MPLTVSYNYISLNFHVLSLPSIKVGVTMEISAKVFRYFMLNIMLKQDLNGIYEGILSGVVDDPSVLNMMKKGEVKEKLKICRHNLGLINVGVNRYLEKKRLFFPRLVKLIILMT